MPEMDSTKTLGAIATGDMPVLETIAKMTLDTMKLSHLDQRSYFLVRIAGLVASDAPPVSYLVNAKAAADVIGPDDLRSILIALAPVVGSARIASAAGNMIRAFVAEMELEDAADQLEKAESNMAKAHAGGATRRR